MAKWILCATVTGTLTSCSGPQHQATPPSAAHPEPVRVSCNDPARPNPPLDKARTEEQRYLDLQQQTMGKPKVTLSEAFPTGFDAAYGLLSDGAVSWTARNMCDMAHSGQLGHSQLLDAALRSENLIGASISTATGFCALIAGGNPPKNQDQVDRALHSCPQLVAHPSGEPPPPGRR
jgi:hypothetical protein